ncbi:MAG: DUF2520 domain-containing protein [Planctomycetota bacterium]
MARPPFVDLGALVLGPGAVGEALARELARGGAAVELWARRPERAAAVAERLGAEPLAGAVRAAPDLAGALAACGLVLVCVSDDAIAAVAERAAGVRADASGRVALHTNGFLGSEALAPLERAGAATGVLHPLAPLPPRLGPVEEPAPLAGAWFAVSGMPEARALARRVVAGLGGHELELAASPDAQPRYHAAASLASGGMVALIDAALAPFAAAATDPDAAREALLDLVERTLANLRARGTAGALTGPAARGSAELLNAQLAALAPYGAAGHDAAPLYRELVDRMLLLAEERGSISAEDRRRVASLLRRS